jgi:hypothetical protein
MVGRPFGDFCPGSGFGGWDHMKNTGKRIFFASVAFTLSNLVLFASAGLLTSQR